MTSPAILIGVHCRRCRNLIPLSIAGQLGSEETGHLCERCLETDRENLHTLATEVTEFWRKDVYVDMGSAVAPNCAICDTVEGDERVLEYLDGKAAMLCLPCGDRYLKSNRDKIRNTRLEWDLKLK